MNARTVRSLDGVLRLLARYLEDIRVRKPLSQGWLGTSVAANNVVQFVCDSICPFHPGRTMVSRLTHSSACPDRELIHQ
ncbi:hypothetical protein AB7M37_004756 [Sinorhizobium fredii]